MTRNESQFFELLKSYESLFVMTQSNRGIKFNSTMSILKTISNRKGKIVVSYECQLAKNINQFPDFTIVGPNLFIQGELKFKEKQSHIIKEINGMRWFTANEFWYVLSDSLNIRYIKQQVKNTMVNIMPLSEFGGHLQKYL